MRRGWVGLVGLTALFAQGPVPELGLSGASVGRFAALALKCARQEYPNKLDHVLNGPQEVQPPRVLHPAFYGCFDWHSAVHGHWMLVRLLRQYPDQAQAKEIVALLEDHLRPDRIQEELAYLGRANRRSFERTYGWAWLLKLAAELRVWDTPEARRWSAALQPLADEVVLRFLDFLPRQTYPIRSGVHPNTAFSLNLALDFARACGHRTLEALIRERSRAYFGADRQAPLAWEPSGEDFLSPALEEAALMGRVLPRQEFARWLGGFLPGLPRGLRPVVVSDRTDPKLVHLDGLNLSRARALYQVAEALGPGHPLTPSLIQSGDLHAGAALTQVASGHYEGEHWLATFAVQGLEARGKLGPGLPVTGRRRGQGRL